MRAASLTPRRRAGYSMIEIVIAMAILLVGVVSILQFFPPTLRASSEAAMRGRAALLAQRKVEELRRDDNKTYDLIAAIRNLSAPTDLVPFAEDDRLAYQFHSRSLLSDTDTPDSVEDDFNVARVIVRYNPAFRPDGRVLVELRFDTGPP